MRRWWNVKRFDYLEVGLFCLYVVLAVSLYLRPRLDEAERLAAYGLRELAPLASAYGPEHDSQFAEEWIIRDFFEDKREGVFVDVGANDYRIHSTTYFLETALGWRGIAVDPQLQYEEGYARHRPRTTFFGLFVSDVSDETAALFIPADRPLNASLNKQAVDIRDGTPINEIRVPTITLNDLLDREQIERVDFLSMDIEGAEPAALAGFDIERFRPALICIEAHALVRQDILNYFHRHGYVTVGKYLRADVENLYFTPL